MIRHCLFLTASTRPQSNSLFLARASAARLPESGGQSWIDLAAANLPLFRDLRPAPPEAPDGILRDILAAMRGASDLIIVAPIYWYAFPAPVHLLLSHWSGWLDRADLGFADNLRGKSMWLITARADPDPYVPTQAEAMLRRTAEWLGMVWGGALHGVGDGPGTMAEDHDTMAKAAEFLTCTTACRNNDNRLTYS